VLIAEKLLLVAVDDKGHVPAGSDAFVKVALTGALLAELAIDGHLTIGNDGTVRTGDTRPGDELLAEVYDAVRDHLEGKKARQVIGGLSRHIGGSRDRVVDRLADAGVLGRDRPSVLRPTRHPVLDTAARQAVLDQVRAAARGEGPVRPEVGAVLALAGPCRLLERMAPDRGTRRGEEADRPGRRRDAVRARRRQDHRRADRRGGRDRDNRRVLARSPTQAWRCTGHTRQAQSPFARNWSWSPTNCATR
jgi:Golgi phosphoprotein 3 (GPP34)